MRVLPGVVVALLALPMTGCFEHWIIDKVTVNSQPVGGVDPVTPVVVFAPGPTGALTRQLVDIAVTVKRDGFADAIRGVVNTTFTDANGHNLSGQTPLFFTNGTTTRVDNPFLTVTCTKTTATTIQLDVRANVQGQPSNFGVSLTGTAMVSTSVGIGVATGLSSRDDTPVTWNAPHPLSITCNRDNIIN